LNAENREGLRFLFDFHIDCNWNSGLILCTLAGDIIASTSPKAKAIALVEKYVACLEDLTVMELASWK
jgi:hypothetical protein